MLATSWQLTVLVRGAGPNTSDRPDLRTTAAAARVGQVPG